MRRLHIRAALRRTRFAGALVAIAAVAGCGTPDTLDGVRPLLTAAEPLPPYEKPAVFLTDQNEQMFDFVADTESRLVVLFFGYTQCPDVCPLTMANVARAYGMLSAEDRERVMPIFLSVDPDRDTPAAVKDWIGRMDEGMVGLTGSTAQATAALAQLGYPPAQFGAANPQGWYEVSHPAAVFIYTPDGLGRFVYSRDPDPADLHRDLELLLGVQW